MELNQIHKAILEHLNEVVYVRDLNMNLLYINPASERLTGWSLQEALEKKCYEVFGNENLTCKDACPVEKVISDELDIFHHEGKLKTRFGEVRDMRVSISLLYDGEIIAGAVVVMEDTTHLREVEQARVKTLALEKEIQQRQFAEEALRESEEKWRLLYGSLPGGSFTVNDKYIIEDVNDFLCDVTGFAKKELVGQFCGIICPKGPHKCPIFDMGKERIDNDETAVKTKDRRLVPIIKSARRIPIDKREVIIENFHNITERKRVEEALTETTQLLKTILDHTHMLVAYLDPQFNFVRVNRAYAEADGREPSFFPGKNHFDLYPNAENEGIFRRVVETGAPYFTYAKPFEYAKYPERGVTYWDWSLVPIKDPGGAVIGLVLTLTDVTERKRTEEEVRRRNEELAALNAIAAAVSQSLDLKEILEAALEKTLTIPKAEGGLIYLFDENSQTFSPAVHRGLSQDILQEVTGFKMGEGLSGQVAESGEPLMVTDLSADSRNISPASSREGWRSYASVPIKSKGEVLGVMTLTTRQEGQFRPEHVDLLSHIGNQIGVAIENARLYRTERKRGAQLAVVNQVARRAASILDLDQLLHEVVTAVQQSFNYHHVGLFLLDEAADKLEMRAIAGGFADVAPPDHRLAWGEGIAGWTAKTGHPLLANDVSQEPRYVLGILKEALTKAELCVPLKLAGQVIGVLDIQSTQLNAFDETDLMAMETLADQLTVAIQNARLYQETVRQLEETETLSAVTTALTRSLDLDQVLQSIVDSATRLIPASTSGVIHLADEAVGMLIPQATSPRVNIRESMGMPIGKGIAGLVMQVKRLINVPNVEEDSRFFPLDTGTLKKSLLTAPLMTDGDCIGTLSLNSDQVGAFSAYDERLLKTLAAQATIAVRNARLHHEIQRRVEELVFLNRVVRTLNSSLDLEQILATVIEETALVLRTEAGSVLLLDEESSELVFKAAVGPRVEKVKGLRFPLSQGIAGWVAREGQRLLVTDVEKDHRFYPGIDGITSFVTKSILAAPIKVKGKVIGVIEAVNKTEGDFSQADVALLSSIAQSAAISIENARLYKELQNRMEELKRTQTQLIQSAKLAAIGELAAGVAHEINNPLTGIMGFTRLLLQRVHDDNPMKKDLQIIDREAARTKAIVRALLDFARQREPHLRPENVNEIVRTTMTLIRHQAKSARVIIKESFDETLPLVLLDTDQIKQVFLNMMTNAIHAMPKGGELKVVTAYRPQAWNPDPAERVEGANCVAVEFHDTGTGISAEDLPRIFDPFFTTKEVGQGTGLGLSISHGIVERHGGWIEVESHVGQGSVFTVLLPVAEGERTAS